MGISFCCLLVISVNGVCPEVSRIYVVRNILFVNVHTPVYVVFFFICVFIQLSAVLPGTCGTGNSSPTLLQYPQMHVHGHIVHFLNSTSI